MREKIRDEHLIPIGTPSAIRLAPRTSRRRLLVWLLLGSCAALGAGAAPAIAAPQLAVTMSHANAYGEQAAACPGGHESLPGEAACGVDPYTGSGKTFARESGQNTYTITVSNTASQSGAGEQVSCEPGSWEGEPQFAYAWLRDGAPIAGASEATYTLTNADEGQAIQCQVTASNAEGATAAASQAVIVQPAPPLAPPTPPSQGVQVEAKQEREALPGTKLECEPEGEASEWGEAVKLKYGWLRAGTPIAEASKRSYKLTSEDEGQAIQCQVTASNKDASVIADSPAIVVGLVAEPEATRTPPRNTSAPTARLSSASGGAVTVSDRLPEGLVLAGFNEGREAFGHGWICKVSEHGEAVSCTRSDLLAPGAAYPPITLRVQVEDDAPLGSPPDGGVSNVAHIEGGGATAVEASDPTTIAAAVPFGVQTFNTSVTDSLDSPFTQAGGHPFSASTELIFNYTTAFLTETNNASEEIPMLATAGGGPKEVQVELPPGFVGDPQNTPQCPVESLKGGACPSDTAVGYTQIALLSGRIADGKASPFAGLETSLTFNSLVYNLAPTPGHPAQFGFVVSVGQPFVLDAKLRSDGDYGITVGDAAVANGPKLLGVKLTFCANGAGGLPPQFSCTPASPTSKPFLTLPTQCSGPAPSTTVVADPWNEPSDYVAKTVYTGTKLAGGAPSASESFVSGCQPLQFAPEVELKPSPGSEGGTSQADEPSGMSFALKVPQSNEMAVNATPELKDATVTLPQGITADPSAADGLQACTNSQFGLGSSVEPAEVAACPPASQIGTVKIISPLLEAPLEGQVFVGRPECSPCSDGDAEDGHLFRLFVQAHSEALGVTVKLHGSVSANPSSGRLQATFTQQPQLPFSELVMSFNGGARAPLANPQSCGTYTTTTDLTPWSAAGLGGPSGSEAIAGTPDATPSSSFHIDWDGAGGACSGMPFGPSFSAGSQAATAGASSPFAVTIGREDREQDISKITVSTPPGLLGEVAQVPRCGEAQANAGSCGAESQIGTTTVGAGPGPHPFYLGGKVYLTGPYEGAPFGLSIVVPAVAGPFNLGDVVVRAAIAVNPDTAALTVTSDSLPQYVDGVQLRLRKINVEVNRAGFMLNPTSCAAQAVGVRIDAAQGASSTQSSPFAASGCQSLPFSPTLSASTQGRTSKADGASLNVLVTSAPGQANIAKVDLQLPKQLPSRLTTLQKACLEAQFDTNPASCPEGSVIGTATALTPVLSTPLSGPAYLVSHGGAAFPDVEFVLQGEGVTIVLDGKTDIKGGITYSRFETVPDAPISSFETSLPEGPHSILATNLPASAKYSLCAQKMSIPTIITAQNGKQIRQETKVATSGCAGVAAYKAKRPTIGIVKTRLRGDALLVSVRTSAKGRVRISGRGLKTTVKKGVKAGRHQLKVPLSSAGRAARSRHAKTKLRASLTVGKRAVAKTRNVRL